MGIFHAYQTSERINRRLPVPWIQKRRWQLSCSRKWLRSWPHINLGNGSLDLFYSKVFFKLLLLCKDVSFVSAANNFSIHYVNMSYFMILNAVLYCVAINCKQLFSYIFCSVQVVCSLKFTVYSLHRMYCLLYGEKQNKLLTRVGDLWFLYCREQYRKAFFFLIWHCKAPHNKMCG